MKCMKCGRELEQEQAFCDACLLEMEKYPVSPNATVQIPLRKTPHSLRKPQPRRSTVSPEEQVKILKKRVWILTGILIATIALVLAMLEPTVQYYVKSYYLRPGQNYNTIVATTPIETTVPEEPSDR